MLVDAAVDDPDLHPLPRRCEAGTPDGRSADVSGALLELRPILGRAVDVAYVREVSQGRYIP